MASLYSGGGEKAMKNVITWFFLSCKRYLRRPSFLLILLILPGATFCIHRLEKKEGQEVRIAVYAESEEEGKGEDEGTVPLEKELAGVLVRGESAEGKGLFQFYQCDSEEQVKAQVASRQAECGYVISKDLRHKLDEKDAKRCIRVYSAPSTVLAELSTEVVFASLMKLYDREIFLNYLMESELVGTRGEEAKELAGNLYDKWMGNGSTFRFDYHYLSQDGEKREEDSMSAPVFPVRGLVAVYLFLTGLYSAVMLGNDERKGLFLPLLPGNRLVCRLAVLGAPVFLAALSAIGALGTGGCFGTISREILLMGEYVLAVCMFSYGIKMVCRVPQVVCCLIPLFLVGSLVFTPVFVDIRQFFPAWGWMEKLFLPAYYLRRF